jgi:hypothetical protein
LGSKNGARQGEFIMVFHKMNGTPGTIFGFWSSFSPLEQFLVRGAVFRLWSSL